jgi:hypothetical protein
MIRPASAAWSAIFLPKEFDIRIATMRQLESAGEIVDELLADYSHQAELLGFLDDVLRPAIVARAAERGRTIVLEPAAESCLRLWASLWIRLRPRKNTLSCQFFARKIGGRVLRRRASPTVPRDSIPATKKRSIA